ncbi:four helix bundle protein [Deinococcus pimensis]|uniref:four helix bundle protein n=1 Tax=Deinococcus pimensis TaxID=309888 RepID=UPI0004837963|nr:four helix bundle protein [Deinococcus pimensis]
MRDFRTLVVWQRAHRLTLDVYDVTKGFPPEERFGLASQLRRSAVSVGSNIAEGCGRPGPTEFRRFLGIAMSSACEVEYQIMLCIDLHLVPGERGDDLLAAVREVKRMLTGLLARLTSPDTLLADR